MLYNIPVSAIFQNAHVWTFSSRLFPSFLNTSHKTKQKKILEQQEKQYNLKTIRRWPFHYVSLAQSNYYLSLFHTILCVVGYPDMHASKYYTDASLILQKHNRALCNSLKNLKTIKGPYSGPQSWSQTYWPWSFQQYISPGFLMTTPQSFAQQVPTWSN